MILFLVLILAGILLSVFVVMMIQLAELLGRASRAIWPHIVGGAFLLFLVLFRPKRVPYALRQALARAKQ